MKFLLEKEDDNYKISSDNYAFLTKEEKLKLIQNQLKNTNIDGIEWSHYIIDDNDIKLENNPLFKLAFKIPNVNIGEITDNTLLGLADNNNPYSDTIVEANWIEDPSLYEGNDNDVAFKIKALTLANKNNIKASEFKTKDGKWLPPGLFRNQANELLSHLTIDKSDTIYDYMYKNNLIQQIRTDDKEGLKRSKRITFLILSVLPKVNDYKDIYKKLKNNIDNIINDNRNIIDNILKQILDKPYNNENEQKVYTMIIKSLINKIPELANILGKKKEEDPYINDKKSIIIGLMNYGKTKEEATSLVNKTFNPKKSIESNVQAALRAGDRF